MKRVTAALFALAALFSSSAFAQLGGNSNAIYPFNFLTQATFPVESTEGVITSRTMRFSENDLLQVFGAPRGSKIGAWYGLEGPGPGSFAVVIFDPANPGEPRVVGYVISGGLLAPESSQLILDAPNSRTALAQSLFIFILGSEGIGLNSIQAKEQRPAARITSLQIVGIGIEQVLFRKFSEVAPISTSAELFGEIIKISPNPAAKKLPTIGVLGNGGVVGICEEVQGDVQPTEVVERCSEGLANQAFFATDFTAPIGFIPEEVHDDMLKSASAARARVPMVGNRK